MGSIFNSKLNGMLNTNDTHPSLFVDKNSQHYLQDSIPGIMPKIGFSLMIVPPNSISFAIITSLAKIFARKPQTFNSLKKYGDVIIISNRIESELLGNEVWEKSFGAPKVLLKKTARRFNWRIAEAEISSAIEELPSENLSAIIIDAGLFSKSIDEAIIESAAIAFKSAAVRAKCLVLVVVEAVQSRKLEPVERIPTSLRVVSDFLLVCKLPNKSDKLGELPVEKLLLLNISHKLNFTQNAKLSLTQNLNTNTSEIIWEFLDYESPSRLLKLTQIQSEPGAQYVAIDVAVNFIRQYGPKTMMSLQDHGETLQVARLTMRDALSLAAKNAILVKQKRGGVTLWNLHVSQTQLLSAQLPPVPFVFGRI